MLVKAMDLLSKALPLIEEQAEQEGYGFATAVDDPRDFKPDYDSCTEQEIENWKNACKLAEKGEYDPENHKHKWLNDGNGTKMHISYNPFGIGTYIWRDPELCELRDQIKGLLKEVALND